VKRAVLKSHAVRTFGNPISVSPDPPQYAADENLREALHPVWVRASVIEQSGDYPLGIVEAVFRNIVTDLREVYLGLRKGNVIIVFTYVPHVCESSIPEFLPKPLSP
jgi:hypothetical protein